MSDETPAPELSPAADASASPQAPPATFEFLIHTLFTQALMALGRIPNPITKETHANMATARHFVDMLGMLEQKTAGNLSADEAKMLEEIQHQLRMMIVGGGN
ncbi:MAG: DUF1844 domain-containing protein [Planctomycetota bacterium]|jgi:hypothetical protein|nr:DUF1844 domain-containing protein [Planctomycetota bacterium]MDA1200855.1 DUF1844 domain-containing protein [Planctomycetota bacterium]